MASAQYHRRKAEEDLEKFRIAMDEADAARDGEDEESEDVFSETTFRALKVGVGAIVHAILATAGPDNIPFGEVDEA